MTTDAQKALEGKMQNTLDALGRLSCAALAKNDSPDRDTMVLHELSNFLKYTDVVHAALSKAEKAEGLADAVWDAMETIHEINPSNYDHDDVCRLNNRSVEAHGILKQALSAYRNKGEVK